jgi:hypothetical protein
MTKCLGKPFLQDFFRSAFKGRKIVSKIRSLRLRFHFKDLGVRNRSKFYFLKLKTKGVSHKILAHVTFCLSNRDLKNGLSLLPIFGDYKL